MNTPLPEYLKFEGFIWKHLADKHCPYPIRDFHREIISLTRHPRLVVVAPRFFAKSFYFSFFYPLFKALTQPGINILLVSATGALAETWLIKIQKELEFNESLIKYYGFQDPRRADTKGKWSAGEIHLANGSVIQAKGAEKQIRGFHPNLIIGDDLETDEMVLSTERRKKFDAWFWTDFMGTVSDKSQVIVVGTLLHPESFLAEMVHKPRHGWVAKFYQAIKPTGEALWPQCWPLDVLDNIRKERGQYFFDQEYMNNPLPDEFRIFQKKWIQEYERAPEGLVTFTTIDPATSLDGKADYTAIVTCGVDNDRNIFILDVINQHLLPSEVVDAIFGVYLRFKPSVVAIETIGFQKLLKYDLEQERAKRGLYPVIRELKSGGRRKELRIQGLQPFFESGKIFIKSSDNLAQTELVTQLLRFPSPRCKDDIIDALAYQLDIIRPAQEQVEQLNPDSVYARILQRKRQQSSSGSQFYGS